MNSSRQNRNAAQPVGQVNHRPSLFRALGKADPPPSIDADGKRWQRVEIIKHDSWAATARYQSGNAQMICKFNRTQPIGWLSAAWIGRWLARRENRMYRRFRDIDGIAQAFPEVQTNGRRLENASAHEYIEGHPLRWHDRVDDDFFPDLERILAQIHAKRVAYVDMNKAENIIVDATGRPHLIDFQISVRLPGFWPFSSLLRILQQCDRYHLQKHAGRFRPDRYRSRSDQTNCGKPSSDRSLPFWIRVHRSVARPLRELRRKLLVRLGIRSKTGKAKTERFVEQGLRAVDVNDTRQQKPILRLYQFLLSPEYRRRLEKSSRAATEQIYLDLLEAEPPHSLPVYTASEFAQDPASSWVIALLRSKAFVEISGAWEPQYLDRVLEKLKRQDAAEVSPRDGSEAGAYQAA